MVRIHHPPRNTNAPALMDRSILLCSELVEPSDLDESLTVSRLEILGDDQDEVDQSPDAKATKGEELGDTETCVSKVEAVDAESAKEEGKQDCGYVAFWSLLCHAEYLSRYFSDLTPMAKSVNYGSQMCQNWRMNFRNCNKTSDQRIFEHVLQERQFAKT